MNILLPKLNLPEFDFKINKSGKTIKIYDVYRKKYVVLTPEEWVRQNFLKNLTENKGYPSNKLKLELNINLNKLTKRCDAVFYDRSLRPFVLLEFKSPNINLSQEILDQIGSYNIKLGVSNLIISNGIKHYIIYLNFNDNTWSISDSIPDFYELVSLTNDK